MSRNGIELPYEKIVSYIRAEITVLKLIKVLAKYHNSGTLGDIVPMVEEAFKKAGFPEVKQEGDLMERADETIEESERALVIFEQKALNAMIDSAIASGDPAQLLSAILGTFVGQTCGDPNCTNCGSQEGETASTDGAHLITPLTNEEINTLAQTKTANEWSEVSAGIANKRGGNLPPDWQEKVIASGVVADAAKRWSANLATTT